MKPDPETVASAIEAIKEERTRSISAACQKCRKSIKELEDEKVMEPDSKTVNESMEAIKNGRTQPIEEKIMVRWWKNPRRWWRRRSFRKYMEKMMAAEKGEEKNTTTVDGQNRVFAQIYGNRKGILGRLFDPIRIAKRREFRVEVSGNRKWIMIGVAVVAVCGTVIYFSVTYGGGFSGVLKMLGTFK